ncbi:MAG: hypothetical protein K9J79_02390 [Desulfobacteraceae bacterium]|nr:hypothetical protein [Desulfobacteraceae bacterium]
MLDWIKLLNEQPRWFASRRFRSQVIIFAAGALLQAAPFSGAGWAGFALLIISGGALLRATRLLPHEKRKIKRAKECLERLEVEKARKFLKKRALINGIPFEVERGLLLSKCCFHENDWVGAYLSLNDISRYYLLPRETVKHRQQKSFLYFYVGNCRDFMSLFGENVENLTNHDDLAGTALLKSYWREFQEDFPGAKSELETAMIDLQDVRNQILLYNNLGRLEGLSGNFHEQISYLSKAAVLLKDNPIALCFPLAYHNLCINLAREGRRSEAIQVLHDYYEATDRDNILQYLNYTNDYLLLARELNDQEMIRQAHGHIDALLAKALTESQRISLRVSQLRMRRNDQEPVSDYMEVVKALVQDAEQLGDKEQIAVLLEIVYDLAFELEDSQAGRSITDLNLLKEFYDVVVRRLLRFQSVVDNELQEIPPVLPAVREQWIQYRHTMLKLEMGLQGGFSQANFRKMFDNLEEMARLWRDKSYDRAEIEAHLMICDEFVAYRRGLDNQFHQDFVHRALKAYKGAESLLLKRLEKPEFQSQMIGMAYYALHLGMGKDAVAFWVTHASLRGVQLRHYAAWLRRQYQEVRSFLFPDKS